MLTKPATMDTNTPESNDVRAPTGERLVRLPEVLRTVCFGRTAWLDLVKAGKAPQPVKIGRASFWQASELQRWIADRIRESRRPR
jgi:prophage regulatory protein